MRSVLLPAVVLTVLTSCSPADNNRRARETGVAEGAPPGDSSPADSTIRPDAILSQLYVANTAEVQLSRLVARKASAPAVRQLARRLAADHAKNREEARALAQKLNLSLIPAAGGDISVADSASVPPELQNKTGRDFDEAFVAHEIKEHEDNIEKIRSQLLPAAQNPELRAYLQKTLTAMQEHLANLKQTQQQIGS
jgi:putative membrane protein